MFHGFQVLLAQREAHLFLISLLLQSRSACPSLHTYLSYKYQISSRHCLLDPSDFRTTYWRKMQTHSIFLSLCLPSFPHTPLPSHWAILEANCNFPDISDSVSQTSHRRCPTWGRSTCARLLTLLASAVFLWRFLFFTILTVKETVCWRCAYLLFLPLNVILMKSGTGSEWISVWFPRQAQGWHIESTQ